MVFVPSESPRATKSCFLVSQRDFSGALEMTIRRTRSVPKLVYCTEKELSRIDSVAGNLEPDLKRLMSILVDFFGSYEADRYRRCSAAVQKLEQHIRVCQEFGLAIAVQHTHQRYF